MNRHVESNLLPQLVQHLLRLVLVAIEPSLNHIQIVIRASATSHTHGYARRVLSTGNKTLLQKLVAALVQKTANDVARVLHHIAP